MSLIATQIERFISLSRRGEFLHVAMRPIATYAGELTDLTLGNDGGGLLLLGGDGRPEFALPAVTRFVFSREQ